MAVGKYSEVLLDPLVATLDTDAIAALAVTGAKIANTTIATGKIAADTILESNMNGAKFTGTISTVTTTLTHSLGSTPTICFHWNIGTNTATIRRVSLDATNAFFQSDVVVGCTIEAYALK